MKRKFKMYSTLIASVFFLSTLFLMNPGQLNAQSFKIFVVSDLSRVFEDGYNLPSASDTIKIFGIRGEVISGQCALSAKINLTDVTVEVSTLKNQLNNVTFPAGSVNWNFVGSIPLTKNTGNQPLTAVSRKAPARFPDYLMNEKQVNVNKGVYQSVWLTVSIPENAEAGKYAARVTVKSSQGEQSVPLYVTVYPLTMPAERHLNATIWYGTNFTKYHGIQERYSDEWFAMLKKYAENMAAHRQNVFRISMGTIEIQKSKNGELEFDFSRFDQLAQVFWDTKKMDYLETGFLAKFTNGHWDSKEISLSDFSVKSSENGEKITMTGKDVIPYLLPAFELHLRQKGWLNKTLFHIQDEPSPHSSRSWNEISVYMHQYAPDLPRIDAIESTFLLDNIEIAVPKLDHFGAWYDQYKIAQQKGVGLWYYTVGIFQASLYPNKTIDMPVSDSRIMHWQNYKYDANGYLHWGWNSWTDDPFQDVGQHIGDGWHVYPVKDGVLNSLRWEQMRNGMQDYEYFWMLENNVRILKDYLGSRFAWIDPKQRSKEIAGNVVLDFTEHSDDPQVLYNAKMEVTRELLDFNISPRIYVQTVPPENSVISSGTVVEIAGWAEPGTKITANGAELVVDKHGLFLGEVSLSSRGNIIKVKATSTNGSKDLDRSFSVK
jgi:hypothetical protein